jgi:selenocysteine-specific elongation factor
LNAPFHSPGTAASASGHPLATLTLTVGTAGHIDHGKTALVKLLTGCDTDTLPEEKARGMTIDLGYATVTLPNDRRVGLVDVPGHERFVHNMVAGAAGIDVALLVIAADDGIMPQTLEHFHILRLLGVKSGMVALTKIDLVSPERIEEMQELIRELVKGSFLEGCPIAPISSKTGEGFDGFYDVFVKTVDRTAQRDASGPFRMHVEHSLVMQGLGTIVSGIPRCGAVKVGDDVELLPGGGVKKVRGVQVYGEDAAGGQAGECVALRLSDLSHEDARRGMVLATPGYFEPVRFVNASLHVVPTLGRPLKARTGIRLHIGTTDVIGHLVLPELEPLAAGGEAYVQLQLNEPVVAAPGDFFVVRQLSPVRTLGGGHVVTPDTVKMRRSRGDWAQNCEEKERAFKDPVTAVTYVFEHGGSAPLHLPDLARQAFFSEDAVRACLAGLVEQGIAVALPGDRYASGRALSAAREELVTLMGGLHDATPLSTGFPKKDLFRDVKADRHVADRALDDLLKAGKLASGETGIFLPERAARLTPRQAVVAARLVEVYRQKGFSAPRQDELPVLLGMPEKLIVPIFDHLEQTGQLVVLSDRVVLHRQWVDESKRRLVEYLQKNGQIESGVFKDVLGSTRKYAIPLLEYWDAQGLTRRTGNVRTLRQKPAGPGPA